MWAGGLSKHWANVIILTASIAVVGPSALVIHPFCCFRYECEDVNWFWHNFVVHEYYPLCFHAGKKYNEHSEIYDNYIHKKLKNSVGMSIIIIR